MALDLTEGPRNTFRSFESTLGNCQENFQVLQTVLQQNLQPALPLLKAKAEPTSPIGSHNTTFSTSANVQAPNSPTQQELLPVVEHKLTPAEVDKLTPEEMAKDPWNILPGFFRAQELAAIQKAVDATGKRKQAELEQVT